MQVVGMGRLTHDEVMSNLFDWQSLSPDSGPDGLFFQFCDALETENGKVASASGFGGQHALTAWGSFWNSTYLGSRESLKYFER